MSFDLFPYFLYVVSSLKSNMFTFCVELIYITLYLHSETHSSYFADAVLSQPISIKSEILTVCCCVFD